MASIAVTADDDTVRELLELLAVSKGRNTAFSEISTLNLTGLAGCSSITMKFICFC